MKDRNVFVCMVASCVFNDCEGGCMSDIGHTLIILKDGIAICDCFTTERTKELIKDKLRLVVDNKKPI